MTADAASIQIVAGYQELMIKLRRSATDTVSAAWDSLGSWDRGDVPQFIETVQPVVAASQSQAAVLTDAYIAALGSVALGTVVSPAGLDPAAYTGGQVRGGVSAVDEWTRPFVSYWTGLSEGKSWDDAQMAGARRAADLTDTDVALAARGAAHDAMAAHKPRIVGYRRVLTGAKSCTFCAVASTKKYNIEDLMPIHVHCVMGGTQVRLTGAPLAATRRWYEGEAVVLRSTSGNELTVTPNHPVLTTAGWRPAGALQEGDETVASPFDLKREVRGIPDEGNVPSRIEDVFGALAVSGLRSVPLAAEDFHGDGLNSKIDVVDTDRLLGDGFPSASLDEFSHGLFGVRSVAAEALHRLSSTALAGRRHRHSADRCVRCRRLLTPLLGGHMTRPVYSGFGAASDRNRGLLQPTTDSRTRDTATRSEGELGLAAEVAGDGIGRWVNATGPRFDPSSSKLGADRLLVDSGRGRRLLHRLSSHIQVDRLAQIRRVRVATHVYNLHTREGWFAADGLIVSNCDCTVAPIWGTKDPGSVINRELLDQLQRNTDRSDYWRGGGMVDEHGNLVDKDGRRIAPDDAVKVEEHGELGPVLVDPHHHFAGPDDIH